MNLKELTVVYPHLEEFLRKFNENEKLGNEFLSEIYKDDLKKEAEFLNDLADSDFINVIGRASSYRIPIRYTLTAYARFELASTVN